MVIMLPTGGGSDFDRHFGEGQSVMIDTFQGGMKWKLRQSVSKHIIRKEILLQEGEEVILI